MKRRLKKKYAFFTAIIAIAAVMAVSLHRYMGSRNTADEECIEEVLPTPLNHLIENSMSTLEETEKFDAAIRRFMRYWDIKGASFALMKNDSLIYWNSDLNDPQTLLQINSEKNIFTQGNNQFFITLTQNDSIKLYTSTPLYYKSSKITNKNKFIC